MDNLNCTKDMEFIPLNGKLMLQKSKANKMFTFHVMQLYVFCIKNSVCCSQFNCAKNITGTKFCHFGY